MDRMKSKLILLRHGQSEWNKLNLFTGWVDIPLSWEGVVEAINAGKKLAHIPIDYIFLSTLIRAQMTGMIVMSEHKGGRVPMVLHPGKGKMEEWSRIHNPHAKDLVIPTVCAWELNERMYGDLQGLNKKETADKYGADQVKIWRRSYDVPPPNGECLADTAARSIPYFEKEIAPRVKEGKNVFVCAHGNSLRSIIMHLEKMTKEQILEFELPTGLPVIYQYEKGHYIKESHG